MYKNTLATVKRQIQQAENPTPGIVISLEAANIHNAILLDYLTAQVVIEEPEIGGTDPNIPTDNNCMYDELHVGIPVGSGDYDDECDQINDRDAIRTASRQQWPMTELESVT